ncbi:MAG: methyltransferase domain-containing protein [Gemmatimonadota bacterium]|nr:methyltransferase domain-containing protein [Gemmatimonadota bacterium]MDH5198503.1 methyltransferase domain-containing protein [Gemmatimonadota bacterium]
MRNLRAWVLGVVIGGVLVAPPLHGQVEVSPRDGWQRVDAIVAALEVEAGDWIADIGAGSGFLSFRLSPIVGPAGRVVAVDVDRRAMRRLAATAADEGFANIDTVVSKADDPMLSPESVDGVVIVNAYHEMREYEAMLAGIRRALRPGGRLVIVDNPPSDSTDSRRAQTRSHDLAIDLVAQDLETNGFRVIARVPDFISGMAAGRRREQWLLVAVVAP